MTPAFLRSLQVALSTLAGFVDAIGFLSIGGLYVAFMSGNSTLLGIGSGSGDPAHLALNAGLVTAFVAGVALGTLVGNRLARQRPAAVLLLVATLLAIATWLAGHGVPTGAAPLMALAMGAENTVFSRPGFLGIGLTYMTGTLVRLGHHLAQALSGGPWLTAIPDVLLWSGMVVGAALGALAHRHFGAAGLWIAVAATLAMAGLARWALPPVGPAKAA